MFSIRALTKAFTNAFAGYTEDDLSVVVLNGRRPPKSKDVSGTAYVYDPASPGIQFGWRFKMNQDVANQIPKGKLAKYIISAVQQAFAKDRRAKDWAISRVEVRAPGCVHNGAFDPNTMEG